ncbi:MAG: DUF429 domain-containing protein [Euzebyales bacterium]|nr:DUF429 domain-containing protein [Euzebyales bacterium]
MATLLHMGVVGVDACKGGWIGVVLRRRDSILTGVFADSLDRLADEVPDAEAFAIDIPIGLPSVGGRSDGRRRADVEARVFVGPRRSSVFFTPVRDALTAPTHAEATSTSTRLTGRGISQQAFALRTRILEAERWARGTSVPAWEIHPEVSFAVMLGYPARSPKITWAGMRERLRALEREGFSLDGLGDAGEHAGADDVLDAAAAAWSAARLLRGDGISLPDPPEVDAESGRPVAIWA